MRRRLIPNNFQRGKFSTKNLVSQQDFISALKVKVAWKTTNPYKKFFVVNLKKYVVHFVMTYSLEILSCRASSKLYLEVLEAVNEFVEFVLSFERTLYKDSFIKQDSQQFMITETIMPLVLTSKVVVANKPLPQLSTHGSI